MRPWPLALVLLPAAASASYVEGPKRPRRELEVLPGAAPEQPQAPPHTWVTVAWLPLQALVPLWSFAAEARLTEVVSLSAFGGVGNARVSTGPTQSERRPARQLGALLSYYVSGDFDRGGVHVGGAVQWTKVDGAGPLTSSALRPGVLVGPLLGFKWVLKGGFTLDSQLGLGFVAAESPGAKPADPDQKTALLGNFGVGWTF
jgi:hypothetical protein